MTVEEKRLAAEIGERLRGRRTEVGLSQRKLASQGVTAAYISRIEAGERLPSVRTLRKVGVKLGVSAHWLETGELDAALELAQIVLASEEGKPLPPLAQILARRVAGERGALD